jgi:hypothetical protein
MVYRGLHVPDGTTRPEWDAIAGRWVWSHVDPSHSVMVDGRPVLCIGVAGWQAWASHLPAGATVSVRVGDELVLGLWVPEVAQ